MKQILLILTLILIVTKSNSQVTISELPSDVNKLLIKVINNLGVTIIDKDKIVYTSSTDDEGLPQYTIRLSDAIKLNTKALLGVIINVEGNKYLSAKATFTSYVSSLEAFNLTIFKEDLFKESYSKCVKEKASGFDIVTTAFLYDYDKINEDFVMGIYCRVQLYKFDDKVWYDFECKKNVLSEADITSWNKIRARLK